MKKTTKQAPCCIAYLRVSTDRQGVGGLGVEAQRETVRQWAAQRGASIVAEYVEAESGRKTQRPELDRAREHARRTGCTLVVAKLDRLTRNAAFLKTLQQDRIRIAFCDLPQVEGPQGKFLLGIMAEVAELEAGMTSQRTRAALAAAKARGVTLGSPRAAETIRAYHARRKAAGLAHDTSKATAEAQAVAAEGRMGALEAVRQVQAEGFDGKRAIAAELNRRGVASPRGKAWHPTAVARLLYRHLPRGGRSALTGT
jgi:DNA invertase Pin-like site-specific DNA recombinase